MIWKQLLLWWIRPSLPDHVSPLLFPREALVIFLQLGGVLKGGGAGGEKPPLVLCQSFKAQGVTLHNGAPVHTVSPHTAHVCTPLLKYVHVYGKCIFVFDETI